MIFNPQIHHRRSIRLREYDYSQAGLYFVTIVTQGRVSLFGEVVDGEMRLNQVGMIVQKWWDAIPGHFSNVETGAFGVMPNHAHGIIIITDDRQGTVADNCRGTVSVPAVRMPQGGGTPPLRERTLGQIVAYFKYQSTKEINALRGGPLTKIWQRNYGACPERSEGNTSSATSKISNLPGSISNPTLPNGIRTAKTPPGKTNPDFFDHKAYLRALVGKMWRKSHLKK